MDRRHFLKLIALGVVGHELDLDRLLWIPGQKKIFLPQQGVSISELVAVELERVAVELERMIPKLRELFERDDYFYRVLQKQDALIMASEMKKMRVPLHTNPDQIIDDTLDEGLIKNLTVTKTIH